MEARPSAAVFFSFFRRVNPTLRRRRRRRCLLLLLLLGFVSTRARKSRAEAERNETRFSLIRSTSFYPQCGIVYAHTHIYIHACNTRAYTRIHAYFTHTHRARARTFPSHSRLRFFRSVRAASTLVYIPFLALSRFIVRRRSGRSPSSSSSNSISSLDRLTRLSLSLSLLLLFLSLFLSPPSLSRAHPLAPVSFLRLAPSPRSLARPSLLRALRALSLEQPINSVGRRRVRTTILSLSSHRPTVLTPI